MISKALVCWHGLILYKTSRETTKVRAQRGTKNNSIVVNCSKEEYGAFAV